MRIVIWPRHHKSTSHTLNIDTMMSMAPPIAAAPEWVRRAKWSPQQQVQELNRRLELFGVLSELEGSFVPRSTDVLVVTPAKSGTTWITHICHQLRMGGTEPTFLEQKDVVPMLEGSKMLFDVDPSEMIQPADPRLFCTHLPYSKVPKGGKMIVCFRDPKDALISLYHYWDSMLSLKGRVEMPVLFENVNTKRELENILVWWKHRRDEDVLFLFFDHLKHNHADSVRKIARFIGVDCSEEVIERVVHTTTHAEMARHHSKFSVRSLTNRVAEMIGDDPPITLSGRVRKDGGKSGQGAMLPENIKQRLDKEWRETIQASLDFESIKEMQEAWENNK